MDAADEAGAAGPKVANAKPTLARKQKVRRPKRPKVSRSPCSTDLRGCSAPFLLFISSCFAPTPFLLQPKLKRHQAQRRWPSPRRRALRHRCRQQLQKCPHRQLQRRQAPQFTAQVHTRQPLRRTWQGPSTALAAALEAVFMALRRRCEAAPAPPALPMAAPLPHPCRPRLSRRAQPCPPMSTGPAAIRRPLWWRRPT